MTRCIALLFWLLVLVGCGGPKPAETVFVPDAVPDRNFNEEAEKQAVELVKNLGGRCTRPKPGEAVCEITFKDVALKDSDLDELKSFPNLTGLTIQDCPGFTGTGLKHLVHTPRLTLLTLAGKDILASALAELTNTPKLRFVAVVRVQLAGDDLRHIAKLKELQTLELVATPLVETHLNPLDELPELMELYLKDTGLTREVAAAFANRVNGKKAKEKPRLEVTLQP